MIGSEQGGMCTMKEIRLSSQGEKEWSSRMKENVSFYIHCIYKEGSLMLTYMDVLVISQFSYRKLRY